MLRRIRQPGEECDGCKQFMGVVSVCAHPHHYGSRPRSSWCVDYNADGMAEPVWVDESQKDDADG